MKEPPGSSLTTAVTLAAPGTPGCEQGLSGLVTVVSPGKKHPEIFSLVGSETLIFFSRRRLRKSGS